MKEIIIDGKKITVTDEQMAQIKGIAIPAPKAFEKIPECEVGKTFKVGDYEFIALAKTNKGVYAILKDTLGDNRIFGNNNNYANSDIRKFLRDFADEIGEIIGKENLVPHTVDLISNDGLKDYGTVEDLMSLMTCDMYRAFVDILDAHKLDKWWWLSTPFSTPKHGYSSSVMCVSPLGYIGVSNSCYYGGVRPFCIFNSNIFVS